MLLIPVVLEHPTANGPTAWARSPRVQMVSGMGTQVNSGQNRA